MSAHSIPVGFPRARRWLPLMASAGLAWNLFGAFQFVRSLMATTETLVSSGLTQEQAVMMTTLPTWMTLAFGLGVAGGLAGSGLLLARHAAARSVLAASLTAYGALWIGDLAHGVFAAMGPPQILVLTLVVLIAAALYAASRHPMARA